MAGRGPVPSPEVDRKSARGFTGTTKGLRSGEFRIHRRTKVKVFGGERGFAGRSPATKGQEGAGPSVSRGGELRSSVEGFSWHANTIETQGCSSED